MWFYSFSFWAILFFPFKCPESLEKLYRALKNIAPTSVYSEQAFSIAGSFVPSRRSRLSDISIDDLCFEKDYFDNNGY